MHIILVNINVANNMRKKKKWVKEEHMKMEEKICPFCSFRGNRRRE